MPSKFSRRVLTLAASCPATTFWLRFRSHCCRPEGRAEADPVVLALKFRWGLPQCVQPYASRTGSACDGIETNGNNYKQWLQGLCYLNFGSLDLATFSVQLPPNGASRRYTSQRLPTNAESIAMRCEMQYTIAPNEAVLAAVGYCNPSVIERPDQSTRNPCGSGG